MTIALTVDGHHVEVEPASVLDAVNLVGVALPQLCKDPDRPRRHLPDLPGGHRRVARTPAACTVPAEEGMAVRTDAPEVVRVRRGVLQLTLDMLPEGDPALLRELATAVATHGIIRGRFLPERPLPMQRPSMPAIPSGCSTAPAASSASAASMPASTSSISTRSPCSTARWVARSGSSAMVW